MDFIAHHPIATHVPVLIGFILIYLEEDLILFRAIHSLWLHLLGYLPFSAYPLPVANTMKATSTSTAPDQGDARQLPVSSQPMASQVCLPLVPRGMPLGVYEHRLGSLLSRVSP